MRGPRVEPWGMPAVRNTHFTSSKTQNNLNLASTLVYFNFYSLPCMCGYLAINRKHHLSVVAVVSVPAANKLVTVNVKFFSWKKESLSPESWRNLVKVIKFTWKCFLYKSKKSHDVLPRLSASWSENNPPALCMFEGSEFLSDSWLTLWRV